MNKYTFKQCLNAIDRLEIQGLTPAELKSALFDRVRDRIHHLTFQDIDLLVDTLLKHHLIKQFGNICDLTIPLTVFARSPHNSISEALSFCESMFQDQKRYDFFRSGFDKSFSQHDINALFESCSCFQDVVFEVELFDEDHGRYFLKPSIKPILLRLELERATLPLLSTISLAYFVRDMTRLQNIPFRNQNSSVVRYMNYKHIMNAVPYRGIPEKRDASEGLQSFFKDCLFHEFEHQCGICSISIPQILIASHIKPFRDCGHLIEAGDHNNGILLCRNHDFLFDQGYIAFENDGTILVSPSLSKSDYVAYQIDPNFQLDKKLLTRMRKQFLEYHRAEYFRKS